MIAEQQFSNVLQFADYLGVELYPWQEDFLNTYDLHSDAATFKMALRAPNDSGKN